MPSIVYTPRSVKWAPQTRAGRAINALCLTYDWAIDGTPGGTEHHLFAGGLIQRAKTVPDWANVAGVPWPRLRSTGEAFDPSLWIHARNGNLVQPGSPNARPWTYGDVVLQTIARDPVAMALQRIERNLARLAAKGWRTRPDARLIEIDDDGGRGIVAVDTLALIGVQRGLEVAAARPLDQGEVSATYSASIAASADDAHGNNGGTPDETGTHCRIYSSSSTPSQWAGAFRFTGAGALPGSTISAADITFAIFGGDNDIDSDFHCEDSDSPAQFSSSDGPYDRTLTTASVGWSEATSDPATSPDLASPVQEWADRAGAGSVFCVIGVGRTTNPLNRFEAVAFDHGSLAEPSVDVTYTAGGAVAIAGVIAGSTTTAGALSRRLGLSAAISATSAVAGSLSRRVGLVATVAANAVLAGLLSTAGAVQFVGQIAATSTVAGALAVRRSFAGAVTANSTAAGSLGVRRRFAGVISATANVAGSLTGALTSVSPWFWRTFIGKRR